MLVRPELEALLGDGARQRRLQSRLAETLAEWRRSAQIEKLEQELARFSAGVELHELPRLAELCLPGGAVALQLAGQFIASLCAELAQSPLGQVPLRHYTDDVLTTLVLARSGNASLSLNAIDGAGLARHPPPLSVSFPPGLTHEVVLAGSARIERVRLTGLRTGGAALAREQRTLNAGMVSSRDGAREADLLRQIPGSLVTLKLQRRAGRGAVTREYRLADGRLLHQSAASPHDSRLELAAALLGRMGRRDGAPLLAELAREQGSLSLRWQALRECLGLDTATGFAALEAIAACEADPLAEPARALRSQLVATYPQLEEFSPCPA